MMAEDLEASLLSNPANEVSRSSGSEAAPVNHQQPQQNRVAMPPSRILHHGPTHGNKPPGPAPALPAGARVTTLQELEAGLRDVHVAPSGGAGPVPDTISHSQPDLSAFQKLLGLVTGDEAVAEVSVLRCMLPSVA
jgi:hypothetical protein